jgi:hypothetical protein
MTRLLFCAIAACAVASATKVERRDFTDAIVDADKQLATAKREFTKNLKPFQDGQPGNVLALRHSFQAFVKAIASARAMAQKLKIPNYPDCREFHKAFVAFLAAEDEVARELAEVVKKVEAKKGKLDLLAKLEIVGSMKKCGHIEKAPRDGFFQAAQEVDRIDKTMR